MKLVYKTSLFALSLLAFIRHAHAVQATYPNPTNRNQTISIRNVGEQA